MAKLVPVALACMKVTSSPVIHPDTSFFRWTLLAVPKIIKKSNCQIHCCNGKASCLRCLATSRLPWQYEACCLQFHSSVLEDNISLNRTSHKSTFTYYCDPSRMLPIRSSFEWECDVKLKLILSPCRYKIHAIVTKETLMTMSNTTWVSIIEWYDTT